MGESSSSESSRSFEALLRRAARISAVPRRVGARPRPGDELCDGRYRVDRVLGEGGMGVVYEAFDREHHRSVALKTLNRLDADGIYRLKNEFRSLAEVVHPNLVRLHELFVDGTRWFFSMELVPGLPFDAWVRPERVLDEARLRSALRQLVAGTHAVHAAGKLHCDLKPSNVLVTATGRLVILDLGLVADPAGGIGRTLGDDAMGGTPAYMAPEQAAQRGLSPASDWYAVGVMLFEGLTGRLPFEGSVGEILARKQGEDAPSPESLGALVAPDLATLCHRLLAHDPAARPGVEALVATAGAPAGSEMLASPRTLEGTSLVGREIELDALHDAYALAQSGRPTVVRLVGESGAGKSALAARFLEDVSMREGAVVLGGRCYEAESVPYKAFDRLIDELTRYLRRLSPVEAASLLPRDVSALARLFPVLDRVDTVAHAPTREARDELELRDRAFDALAELLARIRDRRPLVLYVDDIQWTDFDSVLLLERLVGDPEGAPVLYVLSQRALAGPREAELERLERAVRANDRAVARRLVLGPLSREAGTTLAHELLGDVPNVAELARSIANEAAGNPFFLSELVRHLGSMGPQAPPGRVSLRDVLHARLARLDARARDLLDLVALSGRPLPVDVIENAVGASGDTHADLLELGSLRLVRKASERAYECFHDRLRVALVEELAPQTTPALHARLVRAWSTQPDPDPEVLFEHFRGAGLRDEAARQALRAAERANHNLAFERCAELHAQAIALLPEDEIERLDLRERRAEALSMAGRWADAGAAFADAAERARGRRRVTYLGYQAATHYLASGQPREGLPRLRWVLSRTGVRWPRTRVGAALAATWHMLRIVASGARYELSSLSGPTHFDGRGKTAARLFPDGDEPPGETVQLEMLLAGAALVPPYDFTRGTYFIVAFARHALRMGDRERVPVALGMLSVFFAASRRTAGLAKRLVEQAISLARVATIAPLASAALSFAAFSRLRAGAAAEALALGKEAEQALHGLQRAYAYEAWTARAVQCFALILMGRLGEAADLFAATGREARELGDELATLGGESPIRYLVKDDVDGALELVERKRAALAHVGRDGIVHQVVLMDRIACALYGGRGGDALPLFREAFPAVLATVDAKALSGICALQAIEAGGATAALRRVVERAIRRLRREGLTATLAYAAQLEAALRLLDGEDERACELVRAAAERYAAAGMQLHETILRWHRAKLEGGSNGDAARVEAERSMRALGIANPTRWARMLAPGLERRPRA